MAYILAKEIRKEYNKSLMLGKAKYIHYFIESNKLEQYREAVERYFYVWGIDDILHSEPAEGGEE